MPLSFVNDATRFLFRHFDTVEEWPLQVYVSAVIWSPGSSLVRKRNLERVPWLRNVAPLEATWGPRKLRFSREIDHRAQSKISSDGKLLVTVCGRLDYKLSSAIYVWDIAAKIMAWEFFSGSTQNIRELGFSQDNKRILWIAEVDSVHSWEISSDDVRATPVEFPGFGEIVALSSAGMQVASIVSGHGILIWDTLTGKIRVKVSLSYPEYEKSIFFSLNDTQIMCEVSGQEVCIWDTTTGRLKERLVKPPDFLHSLAHSPDGIHICYRSPEAEILFWNTQNGHVRRLEGCTCREQRPVISPDVKKVTYQHGLYTYVWDFFTGEVRKFLYVGSFQDPMEKAFSPINNSLVYLTYDGDIHVEYLEASSFECWEYWGARKKILSSHMYDEIPIHAAFSHDGKRVVLCGGAESNFTIVDARTGVTEKTIPLPVDIEERITAAKFLPRDEKIVVARKGHIMVWESADKGFRLKRGDTVSTISHSPDGKYLAGIINDREIRIWNMQTGALIMTTKDRSTDFLRCLAFSPDGKRIASYASYTAPLDVNMPPMLTLNVWDISQSLHTSNPFGRALNKHIRGIKPKKIELQPSWCRDILEFSSDGCYLLTGQGPIMVSNIVSEGDSLTADLPSLYIDEHCDDPDKNLWIFWGKQPFIRIAFHSLVVDRYLGMYGLDVQGGKIIFQYRYPEMLILDVDTKVLTETLSSHDYPSV